jgi:hypothetical protein
MRNHVTIGATVPTIRATVPTCPSLFGYRTSCKLFFNQLSFEKSRYVWRILSSEMWLRAVWQKFSVSKKHTASMFSIEENKVCLLDVLFLSIRPWRWRKCLLLKRGRTSAGVHENAFQKVLNSLEATKTPKKNSMVWVRERTTPTERRPFVGEVIANFCGERLPRGQRDGSYGRILGFLDRSRYFSTK